MSSLHILDLSPISDIQVVHIFSLSTGCLLIFLITFSNILCVTACFKMDGPHSMVYIHFITEENKMDKKNSEKKNPEILFFCEIDLGEMFLPHLGGSHSTLDGSLDYLAYGLEMIQGTFLSTKFLNA